MRTGAELDTARLRLRPFAEADIDAVVTAFAEWEVVRWLSAVPFPYGRDDALAFLDRSRELVGQVWTIHDEEGLAGGIGAAPNLGYWLLPRAWGRGYLTEAGTAVIDAVFAHWQRRRDRDLLYDGERPFGARPP